MENNTIRVSKNGKIGTISEAQVIARENPGSTVIVEAGIYRESLEFDSRDNGTTYIGEGAVLTGGLDVAYADTKDIPEDIASRLTPEAAAKVRVIDLKEYGFTHDDWGDVYPIGSYSTADKYDDAKLGINLEVFSGGRRMILARYPNNSYDKISDVIDMGDVWEYPSQNYFYDWNDRRNHRGGTYVISRETNKRIKNWKEPETAWIFGYFYQDWADASSPITVKPENRVIFPKFVARYGCKRGADYYLYNVLEELDVPGEYYLDRKSGMLYVYPYADGDTIEISLSEKNLIRSSGADNLTIDGFTLKCARNTAVQLTGNDCVLKNLFVTNVAQHGIVINGYRNTVENCEVTHTGRGGIYISGGDRQTLTPGENKAVNNYIHHFSEVYQTYQAGVNLSGVGNICAHNEISFTPHSAILYGGNDQIIEYNDIHDAVLYSADAGAIYAGFDWAAHGCVIRYNILRDIGKGDLHPQGIYWDDGLSGQSAYGNILINVLDQSFEVGGGRDNIVRDNLIINPGATALEYDDRNRDGFVNGGWSHAAVDTPEGKHWKVLASVPYTSEVWAKKYPSLAAIITDFEQYDDPRFPVNPANSVMENNIIIREEEDKFRIAESVYQYSKIGVNPQYRTAEEANFDMETLKFTKLPENFPEIPVDKIGRIKE